MKQWKRVLIAGTLLGSTFTAGVFAEDVLQRVEAYLRPDFNIVVDGTPVKLDGPTLIYQDASYLPLKELGNLLGANILYKDVNKTIYINSRINPEQVVDEKDLTTDEFKFKNPYSIMVNYLGAEYPLLLTNAEDKNNISNRLLYYRLSDLRKMGIETGGMKKSKEMLTEELYVTETELKQFVKQLPTQTRSSSADRYVIAGELNTKKLDALQNYIKTTMNSQNKDNKDRDRGFKYTSKPIIVEKTENENEYQYIYYQTTYFDKYINNRYVRTKLTLTKRELDSDGYTINTHAMTDLNEQLDIKERRKTEEEAKKVLDPVKP
ncbi:MULTISPECIES: stalk domain-containing protein [unclassified Paenibacillus]|uniref:stalk domain-containing protein n=1 Tax=unclassified Paenibacillus TaxID=185978 RepID=UPI00362F3257